MIIHKEKIFIACILVIEFRDIRLDKHLNKLEKPYQIGGNNGKWQQQYSVTRISIPYVLYISKYIHKMNTGQST